MAANRSENHHQQRGVLSLLQSRRPGHGCPSAAAEGHRSHGVRSRRRLALVCCPVRSRYADRFIADNDRLSGIRRRSAGGAGAVSGNGARRLPRRRAGQDPARTALRRAGAFQVDPAHAVLRHSRRDAVVSGSAARSMASHRRPRADRAAIAQCRGLPVLDRQVRRSRRRRVPGIPDALEGRL